MAVLKHLTNQMQGGGTGGGGGVMWYPTKDISIESLVIGRKLIQDVDRLIAASSATASTLVIDADKIPLYIEGINKAGSFFNTGCRKN